MRKRIKMTINERIMLKKLLIERKYSGDPDEEGLQTMAFSSNLTVLGGEE